MNNWETSVKATTTAYDSQGSALREQGEYMDSYEAKLNQIKTRITELSLAVGDAFLNDALFAMIEGLGKAIELLIEFVDRFGVLPALLGTAGGAFTLLYNDTGKLGEKIRGTLSASIDGFADKIKDMSTIYNNRMMAMSASTGKVTTSLGTAKAGITAFGTAFKGVLIGMGITALLVAVGFAIEKIVKYTQEAKRAQEEWNEIVENAVDSYNKYGNNINDLIDEYDALNKKMESNKDAIGDEELARYNELVNDLQTMMPQVVDHIDENGKAHLRSVDAIKEEVEWVEKLATEHRGMLEIKFAENIEKNAEAINKSVDSIKNAREEMERIKETMNTTGEIEWGISPEGAPVPINAPVSEDVYKELQVKAQYQLTKGQYAYKEAIDNTIKTIQEYSIQLLNADGMTNNLTDTGKRAVEQFILVNKSLIEIPDSITDAKERQKAFAEQTDILTGMALKYGESINAMYGRLTEGMDGLELSEITKQIDALVNSIPKDVFLLPDGALDTAKLDNYTNTIEYLIASVRNGDSDYKGMVAILESMGYTSNDANKFVAELGKTLDNNAIKSAVAREELEYFNEELSDTADLAFEAINPLETLFGMSSKDNQAVISYLETLKMLQSTNDDWQETAIGQSARDQLADYFRVSRRYIAENIDLIYENWNALNSTTLGYYDVLDEAGNQVLTESGEVVQKFGLIFAEGTSDTAKAFVEEMYTMSVDGGDVLVNNFAQKVGAMNYVTDEMVESMKAKLATLAQDPEGNFSGFFNLLQEHLNELEGSFTLVEDSAGRLKFAMADGTENEYLNMVNEQLEALDMQISWTKNATTGLWEVFITNPNGKGAPVVSKVTEQAKDGTMAITELKEQYGEFLNDTSNEEKQSEYLATIQRQAQLVGEELVLATDEAGNTKLEFADGSSSPWLDELNRQLDESKELIKLTTSDTGDLKIEMATGGQAVFLDDLLSKTGKISSSLGEAEGKLGTFKQSLQGGVDSSPQRVHATDHTISGGGQSSSGDTLMSTAYRELEKMSDKIDEVNQKEVTPQVNQKVNSYLQETNINIEKTKTNVERLNVDIETIQGAMSTIQSGLNTVVSIGSALTGITGYATQLRDALLESRNQLAVLIEESQRGGMNFIGFHSAVTSIEELTTRMRISVEGIKKIYNDMILSTARLGDALNLEPMREYRTGFNLNLLKINSDYSSHVRKIQDEVNKFRLILTSSIASLRGHSDDTKTQLSVMGVYYTSFKNNAVRRIEELAESVTTKYMLMVAKIGRLTQSMRETMDSSMNRMNTASVASMDAMGDAMVRSFRESVSKIQAEARRLPSLIGGGIRENITSATSAINDLATNLVSNFKSALGIHSPSRVFEELGGFVMQGLVNGLSDGNLLDLGSKVFSEFGNGAFSTLDMIKGYLSADWAVANGDVQDWISSAVGITGVPASWIAPLTQIAMHESGGNPRAINDWDINAQNGIPSKGLMQTIDPTFSANMMAGFGDIWNPVHNAIASINYILRRYGNVFNVPGIKGLMNGTGYVGYGESTNTSAESVQTSFTSDVGSYASTFASSAEFGVEASGGGFSSAVGNMMPTINAFTTSATNDRYEREETMEDLRVIDWRKREADVYSAMIRRANTELKALNETTYAYRNALVEVNRQEDEYRKRLQHQLSNQKNIHKSLTSQLEALSNTSKHSIEQRKRYNELQSQFESSLDTIYSLENEIRGLEISIADRTIAIFEDYIGEIVTKYAESIKQSNANIDNIDFKLSVNEYSESDTLLDNMRLENEKLGHLLGQEKTIKNQIADLNTAYKNAQTRYGKNSQQATLAYEAMLQAEEDLEDAILARLAQEKRFSDERKRVSDEGIKTLKDYYSTVRDITTSALEAERKELDKNHDLRMTMYDEEIARINQIYDAKIESLDADKEENKYNEEMNQKNSERVELMNQISRVSRDNSLDGKKQLAELQAQLGTLNEEILTLQTERQDKLYRDAIEAQRQQQIKAIETQKETADEEYNIRVEALELQVEQAKEAYDSMINDEAMWKGLTDRYLEGDTNPLMSMIADMENQMAKMMAGDYSSILPNFSELPKELRDEVTSGNMLDLSNLTVGMSKTLEDIKDMTEFMNRYAMSGAIGGVNHGDPRLMDDSYKTKYSSSVNIYAPKNTAPTKTPEPPAPAKPQRTHTIKAGDTLWDLAERFYGNPFKWTTIAQANSNPDPYKLQIGRKLIIPFKDGGYTGDWVDNDGRIAMLHKKELVLNEEQTQHILNSAKIMDSVMRMIPKMKTNQGANFAGQGGGGQTIIIENMPLHFDNFRGTKDDANNMVKEFMTGLKKL